jgi:hypothetical protein
MRRLNVLLALVAVAALSVALKAVQQPSTEKPKLIAVEKLRDNLYLLRGGGGNTAVFVTASGVVVVDTKLPGWGAPLLAKIKELTPNPVTTIINTHTHFDHVSGDVEFPPTVDVIAHENTVALMKEMRSVTGLPPQETNIFTENQGRGLAKRGFKDTLSLGKGADFNKPFLAAVREARNAGRSADEIVSTWKVPATLVGYATPQAVRLKANVEVVLNEIK